MDAREEEAVVAPTPAGRFAPPWRVGGGALRRATPPHVQSSAARNSGLAPGAGAGPMCAPPWSARGPPAKPGGQPRPHSARPACAVLTSGPRSAHLEAADARLPARYADLTNGPKVDAPAGGRFFRGALLARLSAALALTSESPTIPQFAPPWCKLPRRPGRWGLHSGRICRTLPTMAVSPRL